MTHTPSEYLPPTAECVEQIAIPDRRPRLQPDGEDSEAVFAKQFSRSRKLLYFIARRILNCAEEAEAAVRNSRLSALRNLQRFQTEGAFKSWLVRILIDEATLLRSKQSDSTVSSNSIPDR